MTELDPRAESREAELRLTELVARAICGHDCLCKERFNQPCLEDDGSNGPCEAPRDMLILSTRWDMATAALKALGIVSVPIVKPEDVKK